MRQRAVVPFAVKRMTFHAWRGDLLVRHLEACCMDIFIKSGVDVSSLHCGGGANQIDHHFPAGQWSPAPLGCDVAKHAVFNFVPLTGAGREVAALDGELLLIGEFFANLNATVARGSRCCQHSQR